MYPDPLFSILGVQVYFYVIAYGVGLVLAFALALELTREHGGIPLDDLIASVAACVAADLALTPILVWVMARFGQRVPLNWSIAQIVAVVIALVIYHMIRREHVPVRFSERLDIAAPPIMLLVVLLRLGCLAAGCCYGLPAPDLPWAITFTNPLAVIPYQNTPVHPTQLYEALSALIILGLVLALRHRARWRGMLMWLALFSYAAARFVIEYYRGDPRPMIGVLSLNQVVCAALAFVCFSLIARKSNRPVVMRTA